MFGLRFAKSQLSVTRTEVGWGVPIAMAMGFVVMEATFGPS